MWTLALREKWKRERKEGEEGLKAREKLPSREQIIFAPLATLLQGRLSQRKICRGDAQFTRILAYVHPGDVESGEHCRRSIKGATPPGDFPQRNEDTFFSGRIPLEQGKNVLSLRDDASSGTYIAAALTVSRENIWIARITDGNSFTDMNVNVYRLSHGTI